MAELIRLALSNFTLTFLLAGVVAGLIAAALKPGGWSRENLAEGLLAYFILFTIAIAYFFNFVFHVFFGEFTAGQIGWADSPFQAEVGYASLGFAAVGLLAFKGNCMVRLASILGPALFQWGAACEHIKDIMTTGNMAPGNAGVMLYTDILLPIIGFALLWFKRRADGASAPVALGKVRG